MYIPEVELHQVLTLDEASSLMARHAGDARFLAGGTDLLVDLKTGRVATRHLISLNRIEALRGISETAEGLRIGALTIVSELERSDLVRGPFAPILDAASQMAARQVRNLATVGGNLTAAVPCADLPPILTTMHATVTLWSSDGERVVPLEGFFTGPRETIRRDHEILTSILVPRPSSRFGAAYARFAQRDGNAIAVAGAAASLELAEDGTVRQGRVALSAVGPTPKLIPESGAALAGRCPDPPTLATAAAAARDGAEPISDVRGSADYRRDLVQVLTRRALERALARAEEARS